jgi:predicted RNA-binding protein with RPS1 domain
MVVRSKAECIPQSNTDEREFIDYSIKRAEYQQQLFRKKEEQDQHTRDVFSQKMHEAEAKIEKNKKDLGKKTNKKAEDYSKHLTVVHKCFADVELRHRTN